jgi:hypothetical protein
MAARGLVNGRGPPSGGRDESELVPTKPIKSKAVALI